MMRQLQDADSSFSIGSRESRGVSLLSYLADSTQTLNPPAYEKTAHLPLTPRQDAKLQDDDILKTPPEEVCFFIWFDDKIHIKVNDVNLSHTHTYSDDIHIPLFLFRDNSRQRIVSNGHQRPTRHLPALRKASETPSSSSTVTARLTSSGKMRTWPPAQVTEMRRGPP